MSSWRPSLRSLERSGTASGRLNIRDRRLRIEIGLDIDPNKYISKGLGPALFR